MAGKTKAPRVFVPLTKVDETQRLVYGRITQELLDKSGEVMDYETSKPYFEKWSNDIHTASGGLSKGNVRVMHGLTAAGKLTELEFDDEEKSIEVCAKIVDDQEWNKVIEGVYTGFSVGGSYAKRWTDKIGDTQIKKFTANPTEVSIVDNPCVPSAVFSMFKADGSQVEVQFKVENDDEVWPGFKKADTAEAEQSTKIGGQSETEEQQLDLPFPSNAEVAEEATKMAKAAGDGTSWIDHVDAARAALLEKKAMDKKKDKGDDAISADDSKPTNTEDEEDEKTDGSDNDDDGQATANKAVVTPPGIKQVWSASDGKTFAKKADAMAYESILGETVELSEAQKLAERLKKALNPQAADTSHYLTDWDRTASVITALETPFEKGAPVLNKGMYTVSSFAMTLSDLSRLCKSIANEGAQEGGDASDKGVSSDLQKAVIALGESFKKYVANQVDELLAGMDDDAVVTVYDYYYAAAQAKGDDQMAKDVCSAIREHRESSRDRREVLAKAFTVDPVIVVSDEMSPTLSKAFKTLQEDNAAFKKVAEDAIAQIEVLAKRVETVENTPLPRSHTGQVVLRDGDTFMGKTVTSEEDKMRVLKEMLDTHGADGLAQMMIKASHASGGHRMTINR